jgi:hypothetical protein
MSSMSRQILHEKQALCGTNVVASIDNNRTSTNNVMNTPTQHLNVAIYK